MNYDPNAQGSGEVRLTGKGIPRRAKLSCETVKAMKEDRKKGMVYHDLAEKYNHPLSSIQQICTGVAYKWCKD
jgi:hypothetical protein